MEWNGVEWWIIMDIMDIMDYNGGIMKEYNRVIMMDYIMMDYYKYIMNIMDYYKYNELYKTRRRIE